MAKRNYKLERFKCKSCKFQATGPSVLGSHYRDYPAHMPRALADRKADGKGLKATKNRKRPGPKPQRLSLRSHPTIADGVSFCPHCGANIKAVQIALQTVKGA